MTKDSNSTNLLETANIISGEATCIMKQFNDKRVKMIIFKAAVSSYITEIGRVIKQTAKKIVFFTLKWNTKLPYGGVQDQIESYQNDFRLLCERIKIK